MGGWAGRWVAGWLGGWGGARFGIESQLKAACLFTYHGYFSTHVKHDQKQCIQQVGELVRGKILVGHALQNDFQVRLCGFSLSCGHVDVAMQGSSAASCIEQSSYIK